VTSLDAKANPATPAQPGAGRSLPTNTVLWGGVIGWGLLNLTVLGLAQGRLPFDRPSVAASPFALQMAMPTLGLIEQIALMGLVWIMTRGRPPLNMAARAPDRPKALRETLFLVAYAFLGEAGGWVIGPAFGYRPLGFHLAGTLFGCSIPASPGEAFLWAGYNFLVFAVVPWAWFRRCYSALELSLKSVAPLADALLILVIGVLESAVELATMPGVLSMTPRAFWEAAPITFVLYALGTVLPTMVLIYAILLPRYLKLTGSVPLTVILGGLTYAAMHLVEGWSSLSSPHDIVLSLAFAILSYTGPGLFKSYVTLRTGNAWVHAIGYHAIAPHVLVDTPMVARMFGIG